MRIARFQDAGGVERAGRVEACTADGDAGSVVPFAGVSYLQWLVAGPTHEFDEEPARSLGDVRLLPPISPAARVFCVGYNYVAHGEEMGRERPAHPTLFLRGPDSLVGHGADVVRPAESAELDWEGEIGVVVGSSCRRVSPERALGYVAGYTLVADNSIRDWQFHSTQATAGKNWDATGACGPWLVTRDEVDGRDLALRTVLNGETKQRGAVSDLVFDMPALVSYISTFTTLRPGDLIATGTPAGVGYREDPPRFLTPGDRLEVHADGIGSLVTGVVDEQPAAQDASDDAIRLGRP